MREVDITGFKALLVKDKGEYHAIGPKCTHYGAPLVKGNHHISVGIKHIVIVSHHEMLYHFGMSGKQKYQLLSLFGRTPINFSNLYFFINNS